MGEKRLHIALAGNPNTGKSTVFNALTGLKQHTGNWSGKTVGNAVGYFSLNDWQVELYDLPGIYSLFSESAEEKAAKAHICYAKPDIVLVVLDATCLERNLPLGLQVMELTKSVVFCLNLTDEAEKKGIHIDAPLLQEMTGVPTIPMAARSGIGLTELKRTLLGIAEGQRQIEPKGIDWSFAPEKEEEYLSAAFQERRSLAFQERAREICEKVVGKNERQDDFTEKLDHVFLSSKTGIPLMLFLLGGIFWLTVAGANVPSDFLMQTMRRWGECLRSPFHNLRTRLSL